jgi:diguanylate cyclase (GGDEF)-like protein/PAS domain S-box-containing protein
MRLTLRHVVTLCWLLLLCCGQAQAFHAQVNSFDKQLKKLELGPNLYLQQTQSTLPLEELIFDPERHHAFRLIAEYNPSLLSADKTLWLFSRIHYKGQTSIQTILHYDFPLADLVEVYTYNREKNDLQLLSRTGASVPFHQRALAYRSFAFPLNFEPDQELDLFVKVQDAAVAPVQLTLWQHNEFVLDQLYKNILDGLLCGVLLLMAIYNLFLYFSLQQKLYLYYSGFFLNCALVLAILNGLAFAMLWPDYPEINQAILYVATGATLVCLSLFSWHVLKQKPGLLARFGFYLSLASAFLLLFSPLYASNHLRFGALLAVTTLCLTVNSLFALIYAIKGDKAAKTFALGWGFFFGCIVVLALSQIGYLPTAQAWQYLLLMALMGSMALMSFSLLQNIRSSQQQNLDNQQLATQHLQRYYDIYHNAVEGMFTTTLQGQLITANQALLTMLGYQNLQQMQQDVSKNGMVRYYANPEDRLKMLAQLQLGDNKNFEIRGLRADGSGFWALMSARLAAGDGLQSAYVHGSIVDITAHKQNTEQLAYLANHDPLTSLYNRHYFVEQLGLALRASQQATLLYLDIDQFKLINTTCDHRAGDALLCQISNQLKRILDGRGILARLESDEFVVLLPHLSSKEAFAVAHQLLDTVKEFRFIWQDSVFNISVSIGLAENSEGNQSTEHWLKQADSACFVAKEKGRNRIHMFNADDVELQRHQSEIQWLKVLRQALEQDNFVLFMQPIAAIQQPQSGLHYELLLRLSLPEQGLIAPGNFLSTAERYGLMPQIDRWVIRNYFRWLAQQPAHLAELNLANINLSGASLTDPLFKAYVASLFREYRIPFAKVCFEITESMAILNVHQTLDFISHFRTLGCKFALDDFGSGFSSYGYLKNFPVDFVKIDGNFVRDLLIDPFDCAIVQSIHDIARAMKIQTVAEYVENREICHKLTEMGIDFAQGYGIAKPSPLEGTGVRHSA